MRTPKTGTTRPAFSAKQPAKLPVFGQLHAVLDPEDYERFCRFRWSLAQIDGKVYVRRGARLREFGKPETILLSHEIAGAGPGQQVRHRNGNRLDFRQANLVLEGQPQ